MGIIKDIRGDIEQEANLLLEKYRDALMLEALSLVPGDKHTAEELVLQTFEAHLFKREKYDPSKGELLPWLKGILRNLHGKSLRDRAMRSITYLSPEELEVLSEIRAQSNATDEEIEANSDAEFVRNAIAQLPENARSALMLHYFESLSVRQIAQILRKSPGSVKGSLHYARKALAKRLGKALGRVALAVGAILFGGTLLYAAAVATGLAPSPFVAAEPAAEEETEEAEVVFNTKSTEDTESSLEVFGGLDEECLSLGADPTNHESRTTNHETNGDSPQGFEALTANSNTNNEENAMNTQMVKSAAVKALAAGALAIAPTAVQATVEPSVGWEKTLWHGTREFRVLAYTNTTETYQLELPENVTWIDCLVVGGGGGGGGGWGGGGGAGGMVHRFEQPASGTLSIKVGAGGAGASNGNSNNSENGGDSTLVGNGISITANGGGRGAYFRASGGSGGSGGGSGGTGANNVADANGGTGVDGQGHAGGKMRKASTSDGKNQCGSGGGGAGAPGQDAGGYLTDNTGCGGDGLRCDITGEEIWYAGGGGGGTDDENVRAGGKGGGGAGGISSRHGGLPGVNGLGGGGGGGYASIANDSAGGRGGDGIVIVAYQIGGGGKIRNYWTSMASISKSEWWKGEKMGGITPPAAKLGTDTMVATISKDGGMPKVWGGGDPREAGSYVVVWTIPETEEREGLTTSLAFRIIALDEIDPAVGWSKAVRSNGKSWIVRAYTNTTDNYTIYSLPAFVTTVDYLVVGGGGGGGGGWGGGGGAGGMVSRFGQSVSGTLSIMVGAGGAGASSGGSNNSANGGDSVLIGDGFTITANGGGRGACFRASGGSGGSGGGSGGTGANNVADANGGTGVDGQGHAGGKMRKASTSDGKNQCGSGGGGAGAPGQDAGAFSAANTGCGGAGLPCDITGKEIWYAGGGGGGTSDTSVRAGGKGGGGDGGISGRPGGLPGVNGLGSGGGGGSTGTGNNYTGGRGGDGIVIIRFEKPESQGFVYYLR